MSPKSPPPSPPSSAVANQPTSCGLSLCGHPCPCGGSNPSHAETGRVSSVRRAENVTRNDVVRHVTHCVLAKERPSEHSCPNCVLSRCRHCDLWGRVGEDHTCPCPFHDNDCKEHTA